MMPTEFWWFWVLVGVYGAIRDYKYMFDKETEFLGFWIGGVLWIYLIGGPVTVIASSVMIYLYERSPEGRKNRYARKIFVKSDRE